MSAPQSALSPANEPVRGYRRLLISPTMAVLFVTVFLSVAGFSLPSPVFAPLLLEPQSGFFPLSVTDVERKIWLGVLIAVYPLLQLFGAPWLGRMSDRYGRKSMLLLSLLGVAAGYLVMALGMAQHSLLVMLLGRMIEGWFCGNVAIAQAMAADISSHEERPRHFALLSIAMNLGWVVGPIIGGYVASWTGEFSMVGWLAAGLVLLNALFAQLALQEGQRTVVSSDPDITPSVPQQGNWQLLVAAHLRPLFILTVLSYATVQLYFTYFNMWLVDRFTYSPVELAHCAVLVSVPMMLGSWLGSRMASRFDNTTLGIVGHSVMALGVLLFIFPEQLWGLALTFLPAGIGMTIGELATAVAVSKAASARQQGQAMGLCRGLTVACEILAVALGSMLVIFNVALTFVLAALFSALCALGFLRLRRQQAQPQVSELLLRRHIPRVLWKDVGLERKGE
ncbi:MFS transporter [Pokkaliibacter plantistimulans]|uniref:MFS transporter n=1 Tax=Proteobacteria bacterium 228 TaxID=2083153 RepID=A0A2S5KIP8_9PROT|nr:MFS transporter [Pokkaliibacter plantistimulans]PPC74505.1 MFS transporter [Pokkaliibacter plantistimulans]